MAGWMDGWRPVEPKCNWSQVFYTVGGCLFLSEVSVGMISPEERIATNEKCFCSCFLCIHHLLPRRSVIRLIPMLSFLPLGYCNTYQSVLANKNKIYWITLQIPNKPRSCTISTFLSGMRWKAQVFTAPLQTFASLITLQTFRIPGEEEFAFVNGASNRL